MKLYILKSIPVSKNEFVNYWSNLYRYNNEEIYDKVGVKELNKQNVMELFRWKNGRNISASKRRSIENNYLPKINKLPRFNNTQKIKEFISNSGGTIWSIFFVHIHYPETYPIYDQHVHRSMAFIEDLKDLEIPKSKKRKIEFYFNYYIDFYNSFKPLNYRKIDKALWAFGKFLKKHNFFD